MGHYLLDRQSLFRILNNTELMRNGVNKNALTDEDVTRHIS